MSYILYLLGAIVILLTMLDIIWTTLWVDGGAGWFTDRLTTTVWKWILKTNNKFLLNISGALILTLTLFGWFFLLWLGATIFFAGDLNAIVNTSTNEAITWYQLPYFSGFTLFTLGIGDFTPQTTFLQIATALTSGIGMLLITFGASYILSIVSAVVEKRTFARNIMGIGENSTQFLLDAWNGEDFHQLDDILSDLNSQITQLTQQIQAFPLLQYYHSENKEKTTTVAMAVLYEAVGVLRFGVKDKKLINTILIRATQKSIHNFVETSINGYGDLLVDFEEVPSKIDLSNLSQTNIPLTSQAEYSEEMKQFENHRKDLLKIIKIDNHDWPNE